MPTRSPRRTAALAGILALALLTGGAHAEGEAERASAPSSVAAGNGVVVHNVDTKVLAARFRQVDSHVQDADREELAKELAELLAGDLDRLIEESQGVYLDARESAVLRVAGLDAPALAAFRRRVDGQAAQALEVGVRTLDIDLLSGAATRNALSSHGPRLIVALADLRLARGDVDLAVRALEDLLRYWPDRGPEFEMPAVSRAGVLSRLAALYASRGDVASLRRLKDGASETLLASQVPGRRGETLQTELARALSLARRRSEQSGGAEIGPTAAVELVGEVPFAQNPEDPILSTQGREIHEHPVALQTESGPLLITRITHQRRRLSRLIALAPPATGAKPIASGGAPALNVKWVWPDDQRLRTFHRARTTAPFAPTVAGDLLFFPWTSNRGTTSDRFRRSLEEPLHDLVVLSLAHEGRDVDIRGSDEALREDADPELSRLSFCGRPIVRGSAVYTTLVGRAPEGDATELHLACFDVVPLASGRGQRLRLRWRRHVLDGNPLAAARYSADEDNDVEGALALPTSIAERYGLLYVASNTGGTCCLSARDGQVMWVETYDQGPRTSRLTVQPAEPRTWKDVPVLIDGPYLHVAPRDSENFLRYAAMPMFPSRSLLVDRLSVRGVGTARSAGSFFGSILADDVVDVTDGIAYVTGDVPPRGLSAVLPEGTPLIGLRLRDARPGESAARITSAQIPERRAAGAASPVRGAILFPTFKGIYRVTVPTLGAAPLRLWRPPTEAGLGFRRPDRIGNLVPSGKWLWSVTPSRVCLFKQK